MILPIMLISVSQALAEVQDKSRLLNAIVSVESSHKADAVGDNGRALGYGQMWRSYFVDASENLPILKEWSYERCASDLGVTALCIVAYCDRYKASTDKEIALCHHYGPSWYKLRHDPHKYWAKVQAKLKGTKWDTK